jgi:hypothetical protein
MNREALQDNRLDAKNLEKQAREKFDFGDA